jgi:short-subunit dehydrogenase
MLKPNLKLSSVYFCIITGASQGLGKSLAVECAKKGLNLILVSLPNEKLSDLAKNLQQTYSVQVYTYETDLTQEKNIHAFYEWVTDTKSLKINMLINNAGVGGSKHFGEASMQYLDSIILLNIRALILLTKLFLPHLQAREMAYILNVASVAAFSPIPYKTVYPASKAFVYSFSMSLQEELKDTSVKVSVLHPGAMATNTDLENRIKKHGRWGKLSTLSTDEVAQEALQSLFSGKKVIIPGVFNRFFCTLLRTMPRSWKMPILSKIFIKELSKKLVLS